MLFRSGCATGNWPHVPIQQGAGPAIDAWFGDWDVGGATPLASVLDYLSTHVDDIWGAGHGDGYAVVLSDGADTCDCSQFDRDEQPEDNVRCVSDLLTASTRALAAQRIHTHVIGYAYADDPRELEAIAANGDTGADMPLSAGSEASLTLAFEQILRDVKYCQ